MGWFDNEQGDKNKGNSPAAAPERPSSPPPAPAASAPSNPKPAPAPKPAPSPAPRPAQPANPGGGSTLGQQVHIDGTITCGEDLTILGRIEGTIKAKGTLVIAKEADVNATIDGQRVMLHGKVDGNVHGAEKVTLGPTAKLSGNIDAPSLEISEGAYFKGNVEMKPSSSAGRGGPSTSTGDGKTGGKGSDRENAASASGGKGDAAREKAS